MNWDLLGNEWAVELLTAHIRRGETRHAYLFTGPGGVGRRTFALRLAQALNCPQANPVGEPCRACRICRQIEAMHQADLFVVQAEREGGTLKVDQIRELQHSLSLHPYEARYKVALLLRFEEAHPSAMNALLKTLEEPIPQVVILLTADSAEKLLPTIVSRCEVIRLHPMPFELLEARLKERGGISSEQARLCAHISGGRPGLALRLAREPGLLEERGDWLGELEHLLGAGMMERFERVEGLAKDKEKMRPMLATWLSFWRDVLLTGAEASSPITNLDRQPAVEQAARCMETQATRQLVSSIERSIDLLEGNVNPRLIMEVLMLDFPRMSISSGDAAA
jgi:DNA polymerase-3 subunit delta'